VEGGLVLRGLALFMMLAAGLLAGCGREVESVSTDTAVTETIALEEAMDPEAGEASAEGPDTVPGSQEGSN